MIPGLYLTPTQDLTLCDSYDFPMDQKEYIQVISFAAVTIPKSEWTETTKLHFSLIKKKRKNSASGPGIFFRATILHWMTSNSRLLKC